MNLRASFWIGWLALALLGCDGNGPLIINPLVDRWCGERPCNWEVKGKIQRVGSWHEQDYAVSFVSDHAQLSQFNATADANSASCFDFTMIAKLDKKTRLYLELDFFDDGKIDFSQRIPASDWDRRDFSVTTPTWYQGVRFIVRKDGPGFAALAQLSGTNQQDCTAPPIDLGGRPEGAPCENDGQCTGGTCKPDPYCQSDACDDAGLCWPCAPKLCSGCIDDSGCMSGKVCAPVMLAGAVVHQCRPEHSARLGERCENDNQCLSGPCCGGACSECCGNADCPADQACGLPSDWVDAYATIGVQWPQLCAPGAGTHLGGEACANDADCTNGHCFGAARRCDPDPCMGKPTCSNWCFAPRVIAGVCE